jgi:hypothetical protein
MSAVHDSSALLLGLSAYMLFITVVYFIKRKSANG